MIKVTPEGIETLQIFFAEKGSPKSVRIDLRSTGCCDASLGLMVDSARAGDITYDVQGITFVVSPELEQLTGDITIACAREKQRTGFVLSAERPVSEWDGFGVCSIKP